MLRPLFGAILIPPAVHQELQHPNTPRETREWVRVLPSWVTVRAPSKLDFSLNVDRGEMEAICLAREVNAAALLIDDRRGRIEARRCGLRVAGTIGVSELASREHLLDFKTVIERLRDTNARLDPQLIEAALRRNR